MVTNQTKEDNEKEVLKQAVKIFCECGIDKAKMIDIARKSGISERTIYRYFPTKNDLIKAVVINNIDNTKRNLERYLNNPEFIKLDGLQQTLILAKEMLYYAIDSNKQQLSMAEIEVYIQRLQIPDVFSLYDNRHNEIVKAFKKTINKGVNDLTIRKDALNSEEYFFSLAINFRGFMNRIAVISLNEQMREKYNLDRVIENYLLTLQMSLLPQ